MAFGASWRTIAATETDSDSPLTQFLCDAWRLNDQFLYDWIGGDYTKATNHNHNNVNSAPVDVSAAITATWYTNSGTGTTVSIATGALGFTPIMAYAMIDFGGSLAGNNYHDISWGVIVGTGTNAKALGWRGNDIGPSLTRMGIDNDAAGGDAGVWTYTNHAFSNDVDCTAFAAGGVTLSGTMVGYTANDWVLKLLVWGS